MDPVLQQRWEIIDEIFGNTHYRTNNDEVLVFCPKHSHHKRKLSINIRNNRFRCWVCGYAGYKIFPILYDYGNTSQRERYFKTLGIELKENKIKTHVELPKDYVFALEDRDSPTGMMAHSFLEDSKIDKKTILQTKVGFCRDGNYKDRIIFPSFDAVGKLNYFITRRIDGGDYKKYLDCEHEKSSIIFNELFLDFTKPIILVENVKVHLRHFQVPNVVPIMGTKLDENYKLFEQIVMRDCPRVYVAFDKDARKQSINLINKFSKHGIDARLVPAEKQHDEVSTSFFVKSLMAAQSISKEDFIREKILSA